MPGYNEACSSETEARAAWEEAARRNNPSLNLAFEQANQLLKNSKEIGDAYKLAHTRFQLRQRAMLAIDNSTPEGKAAFKQAFQALDGPMEERNRARESSIKITRAIGDAQKRYYQLLAAYEKDHE
jgi:hypothetical protein